MVPIEVYELAVYISARSSRAICEMVYLYARCGCIVICEMVVYIYVYIVCEMWLYIDLYMRDGVCIYTYMYARSHILQYRFIRTV